MPYSYVLNYLFSRAPRDMKSPHQVHSTTSCDHTKIWGLYSDDMHAFTLWDHTNSYITNMRASSVSSLL